MKIVTKCLVAVALMWMAFAGTVFAADDTVEAARTAAEALSSALTEAETFYLEGLKNAEPAEALKKIKPEMKKVREHAAWLRRRVHLKPQEGFVEDLVWRWRSVSDMCNALENDVRKAHPEFFLDLEADAAGDASLFAKRCISMYLQLPREEYLEKGSLKKPWEFGCFKVNLENMQQSSRGRVMLAVSEQWSSHVADNLFYFWMMHRGVERVREWPEDLTNPLAFALRQAEDVIAMASGAFAVPRDSMVAREYFRKLKVITDTTALIQSYLNRFHPSQIREIQKGLSGAEKLESIWTRWSGKVGYLFYMPAMSDQELVEQAADILTQQIPISEEYAQALKNARKVNEKLEQDAKFERKKKKDFKKKKGSSASDGEDKKKGKVEVPAPPAPEDSFCKVIYEYNLALFSVRGSARKDALELERFRKDMVMFYQNVVQFRGAVEKFRETFPDCSFQRTRSNASSGKNKGRQTRGH